MPLPLYDPRSLDHEWERSQQGKYRPISIEQVLQWAFPCECERRRHASRECCARCYSSAHVFVYCTCDICQLSQTILQTRACMQTYLHSRAHTSTCMHAHLNAHLHAHSHTHTQAFEQAYTHAQHNTCIHAHAHAHKHTHPSTHKHTHRQAHPRAHWPEESSAARVCGHLRNAVTSAELCLIKIFVCGASGKVGGYDAFLRGEKTENSETDSIQADTNKYTQRAACPLYQHKSYTNILLTCTNTTINIYIAHTEKITSTLTLHQRCMRCGKTHTNMDSNGANGLIAMVIW